MERGCLLRYYLLFLVLIVSVDTRLRVLQKQNLKDILNFFNSLTNETEQKISNLLEGVRALNDLSHQLTNKYEPFLNTLANLSSSAQVRHQLALERLSSFKYNHREVSTLQRAQSKTLLPVFDPFIQSQSKIPSFSGESLTDAIVYWMESELLHEFSSNTSSLEQLLLFEDTPFNTLYIRESTTLALYQDHWYSTLSNIKALQLLIAKGVNKRTSQLAQRVGESLAKLAPAPFIFSRAYDPHLIVRKGSPTELLLHSDLFTISGNLTAANLTQTLRVSSLSPVQVEYAGTFITFNFDHKQQQVAAEDDMSGTQMISSPHQPHLSFNRRFGVGRKVVAVLTHNYSLPRHEPLLHVKISLMPDDSKSPSLFAEACYHVLLKEPQHGLRFYLRAFDATYDLDAPLVREEHQERVLYTRNGDNNETWPKWMSLSDGVNGKAVFITPDNSSAVSHIFSIGGERLRICYSLRSPDTVSEKRFLVSGLAGGLKEVASNYDDILLLRPTTELKDIDPSHLQKAVGFLLKTLAVVHSNPSFSSSHPLKSREFLRGHLQRFKAEPYAPDLAEGAEGCCLLSSFYEDDPDISEALRTCFETSAEALLTEDVSLVPQPTEVSAYQLDRVSRGWATLSALLALEKVLMSQPFKYDRLVRLRTSRLEWLVGRTSINDSNLRLALAVDACLCKCPLVQVPLQSWLDTLTERLVRRWDGSLFPEDTQLTTSAVVGLALLKRDCT